LSELVIIALSRASVWASIGSPACLRRRISAASSIALTTLAAA
jgi:hypothetical protein